MNPIIQNVEVLSSHRRDLDQFLPQLPLHESRLSELLDETNRRHNNKYSGEDPALNHEKSIKFYCLIKCHLNHKNGNILKSNEQINKEHCCRIMDKIYQELILKPLSKTGKIEEVNKILSIGISKLEFVETDSIWSAKIHDLDPKWWGEVKGGVVR